MEITKCNEKDYDVLAGIWERSVSATHNSLSEAVFNEIKAALVPIIFPMSIYMPLLTMENA